MAKAADSDADAVIFDLEDSVPIAAKEEARELVGKAIDHAHGARARPLVTVRVNSSATGLLKQDLLAVVRPGLRAVFLPKAEAPEDVSAAAAMLEWLEAAQQMKPGTVEIILMIESALGVYRCFDMLKASPRVATACIGSAQDGDLQTDLGCAWSSRRARAAVRALESAARYAGGRQARIRSTASSAISTTRTVSSRDSQLSARLGYVGRTVIHPKQIAPVRQAYAVPDAEVEYYTRVVKRIRGGRENRRRRDHGRGQARRLRDVQPREERARAREAGRLTMDFSFTAEQEACATTSASCSTRCARPSMPSAATTKATPPREAYEALAQHGWFGLILPPEYGGTGGSAIELAIMLEEIGRHFEELGMWVFRTLTYGGYAVVQHGTARAEGIASFRASRAASFRSASG